MKVLSILSALSFILLISGCVKDQQTSTPTDDLSILAERIINESPQDTELIQTYKRISDVTPQSLRSVPLCDLLDTSLYHCYMVTNSTSVNTHFTNANLNDLVAAFGDCAPNIWNLNYPADDCVNTQDLLLALRGMYTVTDKHPIYCDFNPAGDFGEGNTWLNYTGSSSAIVFGWLHRTPFDETNDPNYIGYDNIYSYTFDLVTTSGTQYYYFVEK